MVNFDEEKESLKECFEPGWDGRDSKPISIEALRATCFFVNTMVCMSSFEVVILPEKDGRVGVDFTKEKECFIISFDENMSHIASYIDYKSEKPSVVYVGGNISKGDHDFTSKAMRNLYRLISAFIEGVPLKSGELIDGDDEHAY